MAKPLIMRKNETLPAKGIALARAARMIG